MLLPLQSGSFLTLPSLRNCLTSSPLSAKGSGLLSSKNGSISTILQVWFIYIYICIWLWWLCMSMHSICVCTLCCRDQKVALGAFHYHILWYLLRQGLFTIPRAYQLTRQHSLWALGYACLYQRLSSDSARVLDCAATPIFYRSAGNTNRPLCLLAHQHFTHWSPLQPLFYIFKHSNSNKITFSFPKFNLALKKSKIYSLL